ncbi:MAG: helicase-associated domain-containing protein [Candidatus Nanopelagicales bacterium]
MGVISEGSSAVVRETADEAVTNVRVVLEQCALGRLRCSDKTRRPSAAAVASLADLLVRGDFYPDEAIAAYAWPLIIQAGGLAELAGTRLQLTARGRKALSASPHGTVRDLWRKWVSSGVIDEFSRIENIKGQRSATVLSSVSTRRRTVAAAVGSLPAGSWVEVDDLFAQMRRSGLNPTVERNSRSLWRLYLADPQYGSLGHAGYHEWEILEGRYTLAVLFEYAATLGLLDVAFTEPAAARRDFGHIWGADDLAYLSRYDGLTAVRVNDLGAYVLGITDRPPAVPAPTAVLTVLSTHEVVAVGALAPGQAMTLSAFAERTAERTWRLSMTSLLAGMAGGRRLDDLHQLLDSASQGPAPETVTRLLSDAAARAAALSDRGVVRLVECADPATAARVARHPRTAVLCHLLGDRHLAVAAEHDAAFRDALADLGYTLPLATH